MRRDTILFILTVTAAVAGAACLWAGGRAGGWGVALLFVSGGAGALNFLLLRRDCQAQAALLAAVRTSGRISTAMGGAGAPSSQPTADVLATLVHAVDDLAAYAERTIADATLRAKELEIQLRVLDAERQHARSIIYSISDAVIVTDPFDELVLANESAARALNFDLAASHRQPVAQVLQDARVIELIKEMRHRGGRSGRRIVEHEVRTAEGVRAFKINLSTVPGGPEEDAAAGVVAVLHDVTHEREVAQMKNDFVSNVSHELRTPLASIKAYVELLIDGEADDEKTKREFYDVIQNEANRLGRLIDNILSISRIESGLVKVNKQPQSLSVIVKEALEVIAPQATGKEIGIAEELSPVFYQTNGDRDMLYQAVLNLLSNAVKYTPEGGQITVQTSVDAAGKRVTARILDNGVGIPPKDLPFVFDKFYRAEANSRMAKGTGLGLSLVKHIVETVHGGRVFVESEVGKGSCFGFELELCE